MSIPAPANSSQHAISICAEADYGVLPAGQSFIRKFITGTTLALAKGKIESGTINPNRQVMDVRHGNRQVAGDIENELAFGGFDDFIEACMCGTWDPDTHQIVPGVVRRSFSVLRQFTDLTSASYPFQLILGAEVSKMVLAMAPETITKMTFSMVGREIQYYMADPILAAGSAYTQTTANKGFDSFTGSILADDVEVGVVTALQLTVDNGITPRYVLFEDRTNQPKIAKTRVTGQLTLYFADSSFLLAFNGAVKRSLQFTIVDLYGNSYVFTLPSILATGGQTDAKGDNDITITWPFSAIYELGADTPDALTIQRVASGEGVGGGIGGGDPGDGAAAPAVQFPVEGGASYQVAPAASFLQYIQPFEAMQGPGAYNQDVIVNGTNAQAGALMYMPIDSEDGGNATVNVYDTSAEGTLLQTISAAGAPSSSFLLTLRFDGVNWHKLDGHWVI
jgi:hypothetical protein